MYLFKKIKISNGLLGKPKRQIEVRLWKNQTLPPQSDNFIWGTVNRSFDPIQEFILEEWEKHNYWPLKIGVNTIITGALWARIIDNLLETKDLLEIAPLPPSK